MNRRARRRRHESRQERAFRPWAEKIAKERSAITRRWFELIVRNRSDLALILTSEQGKPLAKAKAEIDIAAEFYAEEAKRVYGETTPSHRADARVVVGKQPVGAVSANTPWNFPCSIITRKAAPAIAVGCTTVLKPSGPRAADAYGRRASSTGSRRCSPRSDTRAARPTPAGEPSSPAWPATSIGPAAACATFGGAWGRKPIGCPAPRSRCSSRTGRLHPAQRTTGRRRSPSGWRVREPGPGVWPIGVVAALVAKRPEVLE